MIPINPQKMEHDFLGNKKLKLINFLTNQGVLK